MIAKSAPITLEPEKQDWGRRVRLEGMDDFGAVFRTGDRVRVRRDSQHGPGPRPAEPAGVVARHPGSHEGEPWVLTETMSGQRRTYWVVFDDPQFDVDGDGPHVESEVLDKYLVRISAQ